MPAAKRPHPASVQAQAQVQMHRLDFERRVLPCHAARLQESRRPCRAPSATLRISLPPQAKSPFGQEQTSETQVMQVW